MLHGVIILEAEANACARVQHRKVEAATAVAAQLIFPFCRDGQRGQGYTTLRSGVPLQLT